MSGSPDAAPTPVRTLGHNARPKVAPDDQVRVVLEGRASDVGSRGTFAVGVMGSRNHIEPSQAHVVSVEVLTPPAPTWEAGDVVRDIVGSTFARQHESHSRPWRLLATHAGVDPRYREEGPTQPLTLLVRAGKSVTP